jgi:hypothetical protein
VHIVGANAIIAIVSEAAVIGRVVVCVMGTDAFIATVPEMMRLPCATCILHGNASPYSFELPVVSPESSDEWALAPLSFEVQAAQGVTALGTAHDAFPSIT